MREEYEQKAKLQREQELDSLVRSRGEVQISVNAAGIFDPYEPPVFAGFGQPMAPPKKKGPLDTLSRAQLQQLFMRHSFEVKGLYILILLKQLGGWMGVF